MSATMTAEVAVCDALGITASANKWLTFWEYQHGFLPFEKCQAAFDAHPDWTSA